jgi:3-carboxy-cis,cis-muconate cycloisomerase
LILYIFKHIFGTAKMRVVFSDEGRIQAWLTAEVALAQAEEKCGIIPAGIAQKIASAAKYENLDLESMQKGFEKAGFPIIPFVKEFMKICDPDAAKWIHYGSTSQDIQDTGMALQFRDAFSILEHDLRSLIEVCIGLSEKYRNTVMAGRSFQQHAAPITFGYKVAVWLEELLRHLDRLKEMLPRILVVQCGGAVGTLATIGDKGMQLRKEYAAVLGLSASVLPWHVSRDIPAEAIAWLASLSATLGKIANEIATLMRSEVGEVQEPYKEGRGGSSTMPQKRNPVICEPIIAVAYRLRDLAASQFSAMIQEHERGVGHMHVEWLLIPDAFILTAGAIAQSIELLTELEVDARRMKQNLEQGGGYIMAESVMMRLAPYIGRLAAHELVSAAASKGRENSTSLREALLEDKKICMYLNEKDIDNCLNPLSYTGCTQQMIDDVIVLARSFMENQSE